MNTTATTAAPAAVTVTSGMIGAAMTPADFCEGRWSQGTLRHVSAALAGRTVIVVTDTMTGHTQLGVLGGPAGTMDCRYGFEFTYAGEDRPTVIRVEKIGAIIPLASPATDDPKWVAVGAHREERSAAIRYIRDMIGETTPTGKWNATAGDRYVDVTREHPDGRAAGFDHWRVNLTELQTADGGVL